MSPIVVTGLQECGHQEAGRGQAGHLGTDLEPTDSRHWGGREGCEQHRVS